MGILDLEDDLLLLVLLNLSILDICRAKCVCKKWRGFISSTKALETCGPWVLLTIRSQAIDQQAVWLPKSKTLSKIQTEAPPPFSRVVAAWGGLVCRMIHDIDSRSNPPWFLELVVGSPLINKWKHLPKVASYYPSFSFHITMEVNPTTGHYTIVAAPDRRWSLSPRDLVEYSSVTQSWSSSSSHSTLSFLCTPYPEVWFYNNPECLVVHTPPGVGPDLWASFVKDETVSSEEEPFYYWAGQVVSKTTEDGLKHHLWVSAKRSDDKIIGFALFKMFIDKLGEKIQSQRKGLRDKGDEAWEMVSQVSIQELYGQERFKFIADEPTRAGDNHPMSFQYFWEGDFILIIRSYQRNYGSLVRFHERFDGVEYSGKWPPIAFNLVSGEWFTAENSTTLGSPLDSIEPDFEGTCVFTPSLTPSEPAT